MQVYKFGGASVKDANSLRNVASILKNEDTISLLVVVSAMGKITNALEKVVNTYFENKKAVDGLISEIEKFHHSILLELFHNPNHIVFKTIHAEFSLLRNFISQNTSQDYDFVYDQIVSYGELLSTKIVSAYLTEINIENHWLDSRENVATDNSYRGASVDWKTTAPLISKNVQPNKINIVQGFIGRYKNVTTTLGREGSDFTAAIFAYCLNAKSVTIWKDVDGVLNAHPKYFDQTVLLHQLSYKEAIEMAFYGASVLHPKTLKPLENKLIPLKVRSYNNLNCFGTSIQKGEDVIPKVPCYILKENQILVSISALDFSFMVEHNLSEIFKKLHDFKLKVSLIQNSALSFSVCIEDKFNNFYLFYNELKSNYRVVYNTQLTLYTIRHFNAESVANVVNNKKIYLKQSSRETIQIITE